MPNTFLDLGIRNELVKNLAVAGVTEPTPIQEQAIPVLLKGKDIIGQAQTGTGKTLAFVLPILEQIDPNVSAIQALIITPTRELALQITHEVKQLAATVGANVLAAYGGQDVEQQVRKLKGAIHIVIGTPGRLLDHLRRQTIELHNLSMLVLDEADQMLHIGFLAEVEQIIEQASANRQMMLFSATMPNEVRSLAKRYLQDPIEIKVKSKQITIDEIEQLVVETTDRLKQRDLEKMLKKYNPFLAIIFCRTKRRASKLNGDLQGMGFQSDELHGDLSQAKREKVMKDFRDAKIQFLVATDVAARGLDVEGVTHVFNYDIPQDAESYIHRIGRTGRAGESGVAITFVAPKDRQFLALIEKGIRRQIERLSIDGQRTGKVATPVDSGKGKQNSHRSKRGDISKDRNTKRKATAGTKTSGKREASGARNGRANSHGSRSSRGRSTVSGSRGRSQ